MRLHSRLLAYAPALLISFISGIACAPASETGGIVLSPATPPNSFFGAFGVPQGPSQILLGPSGATVVLNFISFANDFNQTGNAPASLYLYYYQTETADCGSLVNFAAIGLYQAYPGQTFQATFPTGLTLKPAATGQYWCLKGTVSVKGNPSSYTNPVFGYAGYIVSGVAPFSVLSADPRNFAPLFRAF
jgi:hypothetical protein